MVPFLPSYSFLTYKHWSVLSRILDGDLQISRVFCTSFSFPELDSVNASHVSSWTFSVISSILMALVWISPPCTTDQKLSQDSKLGQSMAPLDSHLSRFTVLNCLMFQCFENCFLYFISFIIFLVVLGARIDSVNVTPSSQAETSAMFQLLFSSVQYIFFFSQNYLEVCFKN